MESQAVLPIQASQSLTVALRDVQAVKDYHTSQQVGHISWGTTFNNTVSTRPEDDGDNEVRSVKECKTFKRDGPGSASPLWQCTLRLPHASAPGDGLHLEASGVAQTQKDASD